MEGRVTNAILRIQYTCVELRERWLKCGAEERARRWEEDKTRGLVRAAWGGWTRTPQDDEAEKRKVAMTMLRLGNQIAAGKEDKKAEKIKGAQRKKKDRTERGCTKTRWLIEHLRSQGRRTQAERQGQETGGRNGRRRTNNKGEDLSSSDDEEPTDRGEESDEGNDGDNNDMSSSSSEDETPANERGESREYDDGASKRSEEHIELSNSDDEDTTQHNNEGHTTTNGKRPGEQITHASPHKIRRTTSKSNDGIKGSSSNQKRKRDGDINERNILPNKRRPTSNNTAEERRDREKSKEDTRKQRELNKQAEAERKRQKKRNQK